MTPHLLRKTLSNFIFAYLLTGSLMLFSGLSAQAQVIFSDDFERATLGSSWTTDPFAQWSIQDGKAYNTIDGSGGKMATSQSFPETEYRIETIAYPFEYGYWREYYLTFGEQSTADSSYAIRYDRAYGGTLQIVKSTDNIYYPEVLVSKKIALNDVNPLKLKVEHTADGTIQLFITEVGTDYDQIPVLQANDTTYPNLGKLGWHISTQTAAQDFFVESISASALPPSPIVFEDDFERAELGAFWEDNNSWTIQNGQAYNNSDGNGGFLTTAQSFGQTSYVIETEASNFVTGYYREYFLIFGQQDSTANASYVLNYDPDFGGVLSLGLSTDNYFYPETLDDQIVQIDPSENYRFKVAKYDNGLLQVYLGDESGFPEVPTLEAIDTTYSALGKVSWGNATQTAGEDFFVEYIKAEVPETQKTEPEKPAEDELIKQLYVQSSNSYEIGKLNTGETFFTDRSYVINSVPSSLEGASFIKTANNDKKVKTANGFLKVYLTQKAVAYLAYDPRASQLPAWLSNWTKTELVIGTNDPGSAYYEVYTKLVEPRYFDTYPYQLEIGANLATPAAGSEMNYLLAFLPVNAFVKYEAEDATLSGAQVANNHSGYSGSGFADYVNSSNDYVEWTVNIAAESPYQLSVRYANGGQSSRNLQLSIDNQIVDTLIFNSYSSWSTWVSRSVEARLFTAGEHKVRLTAIGQSGPNVDYLQLTPSNAYIPNAAVAQTAPNARQLPTAKESLTDESLSVPASVNAYPNPSVKQLDFQIESERGGEGTAYLKILDMQGREIYGHTFESGSAYGSLLKHSLDVSQWKAGTYIYQIQSGQKSLTGKFIKSH